MFSHNKLERLSLTCHFNLFYDVQLRAKGTTTLSRMTFSITALSIKAERCYAQCHYADCRYAEGRGTRVKSIPSKWSTIMLLTCLKI
jgi:hypothetical protein